MIQENIDLKDYTTFGISAKARYFATYSNVKELLKISRSQEYLDNEILHIGGGSNLLFCGDFNGLILKSEIKGITHYRKNDDTVYLIAGAAEKWTDVVDYCLQNDLAGLENLAGIPGEAGASPVQNVGAYGVEAGDYIHNVECFDSHTRQAVTLSGEECGFSYRDSKFKREWKGRYYVLRVSFRLHPGRKARHLDYGALRELESRLGHKPDIKEVADEIKRLRANKLPDPAEIGSAGSFFKNPVVNEYFYKEEVKPYYPDMPCYPSDKEGYVKLGAGWMIEHAGLKGFRIGGAEVYPHQCLVVTNTGDATWEDVANLSEHIIRTVRQKYKIRLKPEVNFIDTNIKVTVLGSGTSKGIPEIGCLCPRCTSTDKRDKRTRASVLVETGGMRIMIDVSPDFREQALREGIYDLDAVLVTHTHYDHVGGLDDIRPLCLNGDIPIYVRPEVDADIRRRLDYCFREHTYPGVPTLDLHIIDNHPFPINGLSIIPIEVMHGKLPIFGYRIGDFAYITDCKYIDEAEKSKLEGVKVMIINGLRHREHFSHFSIPDALALIEEIKPERAYLTHMCHDAPCHAELEKELPENVYPAYDGLVFNV